MDYQFEILLGGQNETVFVKSIDDLNFTIFKGENRIGDIFAEIDSDGVKWKSRDLIAPSVVEQIGNKIEALDL